MEKIINERFSILKNKKVLIACSTGIDSMVLLDMCLKKLKKENIGIVHIHHNRRVESNIEKSFIEKFAAEHNIPFYFKKLEKYEGSNFQAWARAERYDFFAKVTKEKGYDYVLLAHHADDNFETILMRILRSSSLKGYAGIDEITKYKDVLIYRPLLAISKDEIKNYASKNNITYFEDSSNSHDDYERNRMRHLVIPSLKAENPNWCYAIDNYSRTLSSANEIVEMNVDNFLENKIKKYNFVGLFVREFLIDDFKILHPYIKERVMFSLFKSENFSKRTINELLEQIESKKEKIVNCIGDNLTLVKEYNKCVIISGTIFKNEFTEKIEKEGTYYLKNNCQIIVNNNICEFKVNDYQESYQINSLPITIRTRKKGDKMTLKTGTVSISDFLTNRKVPYLNRQYAVILENDKQEIIRIFYYK